MSEKKWNDAAVNTLMDAVRGMSIVDADTVYRLATTLDVSPRSVASKLRKLDVEVASLAKEKTATFTTDETVALANYVNANEGVYTYKQIAEQFADGKFNAKQVQGKLLALEMTSKVKPAEKVEVARTYSADEESVFIDMVNKGAFIEDIATRLGRELNSVRGKALSLTRTGAISKIPVQKEKHGKDVIDPIDALGDKVATMTVEDLAKATDKTPRGIRTLLTRRGIKVADYDGASKRAKADTKKEAVA